MFPTDRHALWLAGLCYLAGLIAGTVSLLRERRQSRVLMYGIICAGYVFQTLGLVLRSRAVGSCPLGNSSEIFQFVGWTATSLYLIIGATFRLSMLGYFTACLSSALSLVSLLLPSWDLERINGLSSSSPLVAAHAGLAMFAYGTFAMLALTSLLLLLRHHSLRSKHLGGRFSFLPSLLDLEKISYRLLWLGVGLFACALAVGYLHWRTEAAIIERVKLLAVVGLFLAYALTLVLRLCGRLVGSRLAWFCLLLFVAVLLSLRLVDHSGSPRLPLPPTTPVSQS